MLTINPTPCTFLPLLPYENSAVDLPFPNKTHTLEPPDAASTTTSTVHVKDSRPDTPPVFAELAAVLLATTGGSEIAPRALVPKKCCSVEHVNGKAQACGGGCCCDGKESAGVTTNVQAGAGIINNPSIVVARAQFKHVVQIQELVARELHATFSPGFFLAYLYQSAHVLVIALSSKTSSCHSQLSTDPPHLSPSQEVVGVAAGFLDPKTHVCRSPWLSTVSGYVSVLAVSGRHRRQGLGARLLGELERQLSVEASRWRSTGVAGVVAGSNSKVGDAVLSALVLDVATDNGSAQKFYDTQGFYYSSKVKRGYYGWTSGKNAIEMTKVLIG